MTAKNLPKLKYLRVKNLQTAEAPQAVQLLSRLLACWSSNGVNSEACKELQTEFKLAASKSVSMGIEEMETMRLKDTANPRSNPPSSRTVSTSTPSDFTPRWFPRERTDKWFDERFDERFDVFDRSINRMVATQHVHIYENSL